MDTKGKILPQIVQVKKVEFTDKFEGFVTFVTTLGNLATACFWGDTFKEGEQVQVEFSAFDYPIPWQAIFSENREKKHILETASEKYAYHAYGTILSIDPIIADFGDIKLCIGEWTHDKRVIGEYIYWKIDRLVINKIRTT